MTYQLEQGRFGPRLVVTGEWDDSLRAVLRPDGVRELMLNYARGWKGHDLRFLPTLDFLEGLVIIHRTLNDDSAVEAVATLRHLQLSTYCRNSLDFSKLPNLEDCGLRWRKRTEGLFSQPALRRLYLVDYPEKTLEAFSELSGLRALSLSGGKLGTTAGIEAVVNLSELGLFHLRHLQRVEEVGRLVKLRVLEIEHCRHIGDIDELAQLQSLIRLRLDECGAIRSLWPLHQNQDLRELFFVGSTNVVDGDLNVLLGLPNLKALSYKNRRHYSHTREELARALGLEEP